MTQKKLKRFVIDTNIVISLAINDNVSLLYKIKKQNNLTFYSCYCHVNEIKKVLLRKIKDGKIKPRYLDLLEDLNDLFIIEDTVHTYNKSPDKKDNFLFDIAIKENAVIITGETKLIQFRESPVIIYNLTAFKKLFIDPLPPPRAAGKKNIPRP